MYRSWKTIFCLKLLQTSKILSNIFVLFFTFYFREIQQTRVLYKEGSSLKFYNTHRKTSVLESLFNKVTDLQDPCRFWNKSNVKKLCLNNIFQKKPPEFFCKKSVYKNFHIFTWKFLCWPEVLKSCNFIKKRLQHSSFPVKIHEFHKWLLLILDWIIEL